MGGRVPVATNRDMPPQSPLPSRQNDGAGSVSPLLTRGRLVRPAEQVPAGLTSPLQGRRHSPLRSKSAIFQKTAPTGVTNVSNIYALQPPRVTRQTTGPTAARMPPGRESLAPGPVLN